MRSAIVVGGSLCGLACGVALARVGFGVTIVERQRTFVGGSGMGVDVDLLGAVLGVDAHSSLPVVTGNRYSTSWKVLHSWLLELARAQVGVTVVDEVDVCAVGQEDDSAHVELRVAGAGEGDVADTLATDELRRLSADIVIGADGYRSSVRAVVDPARPDADYAGYVLWRGLIEERRLPADIALPGSRVSVQYQGPYRLVAYAVPGVDGSIEPGRRQISWAWYDPHRDAMLQQAGALRDGKVLHGLGNAHIPEALMDELCARALSCWRAPWGQAVAESIRQGRMFATPIAEYLPERLVNGRIAILGDAAHVASPMTGAGYVTGLKDISALAKRLEEGGSAGHGGGSGANSDMASLRAYEHDRLAAGRHLVSASKQWSRDFLASVANRQPC